MAALPRRFLATSSSIGLVTTSPDGTVLDANDAFASYIGVSLDKVIGRSLDEFLTAADSERFRDWLGDGQLPEHPVTVNFAAHESGPFTLRCVIDREGGGVCLIGEPDDVGERALTTRLLSLNNELATMTREGARRERELERTRRELEAALDELRASYWHLQKIQEVLPLCMGCGKVKGDGSHWQSVVDYLKANEIFLSHGYCPTCAESVLREHGLHES